MRQPFVSSHPPGEAGVAVEGDAAAQRPPGWGVPRWVRWAAYGAVLAPLPSAVWRLGLAAGLPMGFSADRLAALDVPGWIPPLGGRRVPPLAAVLPAGLAAVLLTVVTVAGAAGWSREFDVAGSPAGAAAWLMTAAYAPLLAWGPLLGAATLAYWLRRRRPAVSVR